MPPKNIVTKEQIIQAAADIAGESGADAVTARSVAAKLGISTHPIFSYYKSVDELKTDMYYAAENIYRRYVECGLSQPIPFLGVGQQYIKFAKEKPELYKMLFLTKPCGTSGGAMEALAFSQELARSSLMRIYNMDAETADCYFRDLWLVVFSLATLIVTDSCPYTDEQMSAILTEVSLSVCKAYKEIPGITTGEFDKDAIFGELVKKKQPEI